MSYLAYLKNFEAEQTPKLDTEALRAAWANNDVRTIRRYVLHVDSHPRTVEKRRKRRVWRKK